MTTTKEPQASPEFDALVMSLRWLEARQADQPADGPVAFDFPPVYDTQSHAESEVKLDPEAREHRASIKAMGEQLHAAGGMGAMLRMSDAIEAHLGARATARLDRLWNGIGQQWWT